MDSQQRLLAQLQGAGSESKAYKALEEYRARCSESTVANSIEVPIPCRGLLQVVPMSVPRSFDERGALAKPTSRRSINKIRCIRYAFQPLLSSWPKKRAR